MIQNLGFYIRGREEYGLGVLTEHSEDAHSTAKLHSPGNWGKVTAQEPLAGDQGVGKCSWEKPGFSQDRKPEEVFQEGCERVVPC